MTSQRVCVCMYDLFPSLGQAVSYFIPSQITQLVPGRRITLQPSHCLLSVPSLLAFDTPLWPPPGPQECNLLSTGIDQAHKVLISTLGWITGASLHDCTQPFHCLVPLSAREYFTSLESLIGCTPRTPPSILCGKRSKSLIPHSLDWVFLCWFCHMKASWMRAAMCNPGSVCGGIDLTAARYT